MTQLDPRTQDSLALPRQLGEYAPLFVAILVFLMVYGTELFSFSISIDEEIATFLADRGQTWLQQGRWGMALLTVALPNFEAIPLLSTVLFGVGLVFATWRAFADFALTRTQACIFAAVHVGFPLWLHIAQFNTLAAGFGFGIAGAAIGAGAAARGGKHSVIVGVLLMAFAVSIYQTLAVYSLLYLLFAFHAAEFQPGGSRSWKATGIRLTSAIGIWIGGVVAYWIVQKIGLALSGAGMTYVGGYVHLDQLQSDPAGSLKRVGSFLVSLLFGRHPIYLGWGAGVLFLTWLGMLPWSLLTGDNARSDRSGWRWTLLLVAIGVALVAAPALLSAASLPVRAYVVWPLLAAWMATRIAPALGRIRFRLAAPLMIGYFTVVATSIGASLFYSDQVVHAADAAMTREIVASMEQVAGSKRLGDTPFTIVGQHAFPVQGQIQRAELFGESFYEHDGGNVYRIYFFMQLQGVSGFTPLPLRTRPDLIPDANSMPNWPAPGSVKLVNGVVVVKLGQPTPPQLPGA